MLADRTSHHKAHAEEGHAAPVTVTTRTIARTIVANWDSSTGKVMRGSSH